MYSIKMPTTKLNAEIVEKICSALEQGSYRKYAALGAGVSKQSFDKWYEMGRLDDETDPPQDTIFRWFYQRVNEAESNLEQRLTKRWVKAIEFDEMGWKGIEAYLAKRFKDDWGKSPVEVHAAVADLRKSPAFNEILALITSLVPEDKQQELSERLIAMGNEDEQRNG